MEISNAYNKALELEGLLLLLKSENVDRLKVELIFTRLFEKISEIDEELDSLNRQFMLNVESSASNEAQIDIPSESASEAEEDTAVEAPEDESAMENHTEHIVVESVTTDSDTDSIEDNHIVDEPSEVESAEETGMPEEPDTKAVADNALFEESADADIPEPAASGDSHINITIGTAGIDVNQSAFAQKANGDIRKVFTLNDNYKFRRELFDNSQQRYAQALSDIESMSSTYEADDYILKTLKLDPENADVKDFMKIISAYFMGK